MKFRNIINLFIAIVFIGTGCGQQNVDFVRFNEILYQSENYSWDQIHINGGGYVNFLEVDPVSSNIVYAGVNVGGIYKSYDFGESWSPINKGLLWPVDKLVAAFTIDPKNGILYLGVGGFGKGGLFRSVDEGESWQLLTRKIKFNVRGVKQSRGHGLIVVHPEDSSILYVGSAKQGVFKSTDGGKTWVSRGLKGVSISSLLIHPFYPQTMYAGAVNDERSGGIFISNDGGNIWRKTGHEINDVYQLVMDPGSPNIIYAAAGRQGIFKTVNGGKMWTAQNKGLDTLILSNKRPENVGYISLAIDLNNPVVVYAGSGNNYGQVYKSVDGGNRWVRLTERKNVYPGNWWIKERQLLGKTGSSVNSLTIDPKNNSRIYASGRCGLWMSDDGGKTWHAKVDGLEATVMNRIEFDTVKKGVFYIGNTDWLYFYSRDGGKTIQRSLKGIGNWDIYEYRNIYKKYRMKNGRDFAIDPRTDPSTVYIGGDATPSAIRNSGTVFKSLDGGRNWREANNGLPVARVSALAIDPNNYDILYAALFEKGIYKTLNGGKYWKAVNEGLPKTLHLFSKNYMNEILINPNDSDIVYVLDKGNGIYKTIDGGGKWEVIDNGLPRAGIRKMQHYTGSMALDPNSPDTLYVGLYKNGIYKTIDGGRHWEKISPQYIIHGGAMDVDPQSSAIFVASVPETGEEDIPGFMFGIYKSNDAGKTWLAIQNDKLSSISLKIKDLTVDPHYKGRIYLSTMGNGIIVGEPAE